MHKLFKSHLLIIRRKRQIRQTIKRLSMTTGEKILLPLIRNSHQRVPKVLLLKQNTKMERILAKEATVSERSTYPWPLKTTELIPLKLQKRILTIRKVTLRAFRLKSYKDKAQMSTSWAEQRLVQKIFKMPWTTHFSKQWMHKGETNDVHKNV